MVLSGPSGCGKGTVAKALAAKRKDVFLSVSATTRPPRPGEREGESYYFVDRPRFEQMIAKNEVLEHACYVGNYYGTPLAPVLDRLKNGQHVLLEIDVQGGMQVKTSLPETILVFLVPPSLQELEERLRGRGTESEDVIQKRLERAKKELLFVDDYDRVVINDTVDNAVCALETILDDEIER